MNQNIPDFKKVNCETWNHDIFLQKKLKVDVLRLDKIHPDISGNKWFKLKYFIDCAKKNDKHILVSYGGPYSNHILALAAAASMNGLGSIGFIRGEKPLYLSHTLSRAMYYGMELHFLPRIEYDQRKNLEIPGKTNLGREDFLVIPEGGAAREGIRGAEEILSAFSVNHYSHICCAVGTGVTLAGLVNSAPPHQTKIGVSVLKGTSNLQPLHMSWITNPAGISNTHIIHEDHFGGYARKNQMLINFMNNVHTDSGIPTDFVYTGKLFFSIFRLAGQDAFPPESNILILHTGGLQGNLSLASGSIHF